VDIAELKSKSVTELHEMAEEMQIANFSGLRKQDLIFRIEQNLLDSEVVLRGEGVLEILPEGYGFLRSQDWNYLYGPDDIYVSPSRSSVSTCARATRCWARCARPRRASAIWPCSRSRRSTARTPRRRSIGSPSTTCDRAIPRTGSAGAVGRRHLDAGDGPDEPDREGPAG
jgi:hypothetical protein